MLGNDFNVMTEKLAGMVGKVNRSTRELNAIAGAIAEASGRVVEAAHIQAAGLTTTSSAVLQINISLKGVASDVDTLSIHADESSSSMLQMAASIEEVAVNVETLSHSVDEVSASIVEMTGSIKEVGDIGTIQPVIDKVAEQTNLRTLNAAIIAPHASEHGKRFAIIAEEINKLAE